MEDKVGEDILRISRNSITFSPSGTVSDGHVPMTHHRPTYHNAHVLLSPLPESSLSNKMHCFVADWHLAVLTPS